VIPASWSPVERDDGERVGWLDDEGGPRTLLGTPLDVAPGVDPRAALVAQGLAAVDGRWFARLPSDLDATTDARSPDDDWAWRAVVVVEVSATACRIRLRFAPPDQLTVLLELPVPVGDLLRREPPAG